MKPRNYCCCAIPLVNTGIYATLLEQLALGLLVGILAIATPSIVGAQTPSFAPMVLAIICFVGAGLQTLGFLGVSREKTILYRRYVTLNLLVTLGAFAVAAAWIVISATKHDAAKAKCLLDFYPDEVPGKGEGETLCEILPWVDIGIMGGLWAILGIMQIYISFVLSAYGSGQRRDHAQYNQLSDPVNVETIPMENRENTWDSRADGDMSRKSTVGGYGHVRQESNVSASDIMSQPAERPREIYNHDYGHANGYRTGYSDDYYSGLHNEDQYAQPQGTGY